MQLNPGSTLGPYRIVSSLGAGGMGEVYRAHDAKLHRDVAIKVLASLFAADPDRVSRFEREAQTLAAVNDPHIAHIYGLEETTGALALVMELVEGEDLARRIARGPVPIDDAIPIARQICSTTTSRPLNARASATRSNATPGSSTTSLLPGPKRRFSFTQNHNFIPTAGLAVTALALMGESKDAEQWAVLARAHHHRAGQLLSPDGYYYEGFEYWIFSTPWLVHFLDAWEHATGESLWDREMFRHWKSYLAHSLLPDGQNVFDFGDIWEGALTRAKSGAEYARVYPGGTLQSNYNVLYRVAARLRDPQAQAVAERYKSFGHSNLEEFWTLLWRDASLAAAPMAALPLAHHFEDSGVVYMRSSWETGATAIAFKAGPPEGHRVASILPTLPEWRLDSGHAHPDAGSFIVWAHGRYLTGDTGYAGLPSARNHNAMTFGGIGQGLESQHDVWRQMDYRALGGIRLRETHLDGGRMRIVADLAAAYPPAAGVRAFTRRFEWDGQSSITVTDDVTLARPLTPEWHLQSDTAFTGSATVFTSGGPGEPALRVSFASPSPVTVTTGRASVKAPGPPGSIEKGVEEPRGYVLTATAPAAATVRLEIAIDWRASPKPRD